MIWPIGPIFRTCSIWSSMSSRVKLFLRSFSRHLGGLLLVEVLLGPLHERQHVAHTQDAARQPVGVERLEGVGLLAGAEELDRQSGHGADGERRAAAGVAVDLGQHQAGQRVRRRGRPRATFTASWPVMASTTSRVSHALKLRCEIARSPS